MAQLDAAQPAPSAPRPEPVVVGFPLDLPGRFGSGWTVAGADRRGNVILSKPAGQSGLTTITIPPDAYTAIKTSRANRRKNKPLKQLTQINEIPPVPDSDLRVLGFDSSQPGRQIMVLVEGKVDGTFVKQWVDAKLLNKTNFANDPSTAKTELLKGLGMEKAVEPEKEKTKPTPPSPITPASTVEAPTEEQTQEDLSDNDQEEEDPAEEVDVATISDEEQKNEGMDIVDNSGKTVRAAASSLGIPLSAVEESRETETTEPIELNEQDIEIIEQRSGDQATAVTASATAAALKTISVPLSPPPLPTTQTDKSVSYTIELLRTRAQEAQSQGRQIDISAVSEIAIDSGTIPTVPAGSIKLSATPASNEITTTADITVSASTQGTSVDTTAIALTAAQAATAAINAEVAQIDNEVQIIDQQLAAIDQRGRASMLSNSIPLDRPADQPRQVLQSKRDALMGHRQELGQQKSTIQNNVQSIQAGGGDEAALQQLTKNVQSVSLAHPRNAVLGQAVRTLNTGSRMPMKVALGVPAIPAARGRSTGNATNVVQQLKGKISRPVMLTAALGAKQQLDRRSRERNKDDSTLSDTYSSTLDRAGGSNRSPISTIPQSYTSANTPDQEALELDKDILQSDLQASQSIRGKERQQRESVVSLLGPDSSAGLALERADGGGEIELNENDFLPDESGADGRRRSPDEDVVQEPTTAEDYASTLSSLQMAQALEEQQAADEEEAAQAQGASQQTGGRKKNIAELGTRFIADMVELPESLIWMNIRLIRSFMKHKESPLTKAVPILSNITGVADHWAEKGWIMCLDCLLCVGCLIIFLIMFMFFLALLAPFLAYLAAIAKAISWIKGVVS